MIESLLKNLKTSNELGAVYVQDDLTERAPAPCSLQTRPELEASGRGPWGFYVPGGPHGSSLPVWLAGKTALGNRSLLVRISFRSTQHGVPNGRHGRVELLLSPGSDAAGKSAKVSAGNGVFYIADEDSHEVIAGSAEEAVFQQATGTVYTLTALLFGKGVHAELAGAGIPGGRIEINVFDCERFVPGRPGFAVQTNEQARGGGVYLTNWLVTPVGPYRPRLGVIGDSLTAGVDSEPESESYAFLATRELGQELVLNTGGGGSNTALDLERFPYEIAPFEPEIAWIEGGTNDLGRGDPAEVIFSNMVRQAELVTWGGQAVLSTVSPRVFDSPSGYRELARLNDLIRASGYPVVDRYRLLCDDREPRHIHEAYVCSDGVHFNAAGHRVVAEEALRVMRGLLVTEPQLIAL